MVIGGLIASCKLNAKKRKLASEDDPFNDLNAGLMKQPSSSADTESLK
jgi:hypothetical protein